MRIKNSIINIFFGMGGQVLSILAQFFVRTIFIYKLGVEYLGVNGLFINILSILSLAELGIGNAIIFSLYKPLSNNDKNKIKALMRLYEKSYRIISLIVFILGLAVLPFLKYIIKNPVNIDENITIIYLLFLFNSAISYLFAYKRSLIIADQKEYIVTLITTIFNLISSVCQALILLVYQSFISYLVVQIIFTIISNVYIAIKADKMYPILKDDKIVELDRKEKDEIFKNVKALIIYKIGTLLTVGLDNIIISSFVGIVSVGIYTNYTMILDKINIILSQGFNSITASVGNLNASDDNEKKEFIYEILLFLSFWIYGFSSICLFILINPLIELWVGIEYCLNLITVFVIIINFYLLGMNNPTMVFRNTMGLYVQGRYRPMIGAIINIIVSMSLVGKYGILGVLLGTLISRMLVLIWYEPYIIYKNGFKKSVKTYYYKYCSYTVTVLFTAIVCNEFFYYLSMALNLNTISSFLLKLIGCIIIPNIIFIVRYWKKEEFKYLRLQLSKLTKQKLCV